MEALLTELNNDSAASEVHLSFSERSDVSNGVKVARE